MEALMQLHDRLSKEGRAFDCQVISEAVRSWQASVTLNQNLYPDALAYQKLKIRASDAKRKHRNNSKGYSKTGD